MHWAAHTHIHAVKTLSAKTHRSQLMSFSWCRTKAPWQQRTPSSSWTSLSSPWISSYFNWASLMRHASHFSLSLFQLFSKTYTSVKGTKSGCVKQISGLVDKCVSRVITDVFKIAVLCFNNLILTDYSYRIIPWSLMWASQTGLKWTNPFTDS